MVKPLWLVHPKLHMFFRSKVKHLSLYTLLQGGNERQNTWDNFFSCNLVCN
jgi:hypothetical protein